MAWWPFRKKPTYRRVGFVPAASQAVRTQAAEQTRRLDELETTFSKLKKPGVTHLDESRSRIAFLFVKWYFAFIILIIIGAPAYNMIIGNAVQLDVSKLLNQIATLLGTPLGFVVGYYFKEKNK